MATFQSKPMAQWAVEDVVGWVSEHGMAEIASKLAEHCIDGEAIVHLNSMSALPARRPAAAALAN